MHDYKTYPVAAARREGTLRWLVAGLERAGCQIILAPDPERAPFRVVFRTQEGERIGAIFYLFTVSRRMTKNRPEDEWRFQLKYGSKDGALHALWQDPTELYTTVLVGIDPESGCFVAADPVLHSPTKFFISLEFKDRHMEAIRERGWYAWERESTIDTVKRFETLVGGRADRLLDLVRFERAAKGLDPGNRHLLAERWSATHGGVVSDAPSAATMLAIPPEPSASELHQLAREFDMPVEGILDMISTTPRLKMAVRGWVAESHLERALAAVPGVSECHRITAEGQPDISLRYRGSRPILIECKNVLRDMTKAGEPKVDFQRTRASTSDPCSRFYRPDDFDVLAACLHAVTERWEFRFRVARVMAPHKKCLGRLSNLVRVDDSWADAEHVLAEVAGGAA